MASRTRSARRRLRKECRRYVESGNGDKPTLDALAREIMGNDVGVEELMRSYYAREASNALKQLQRDGYAESVGRQWLPVKSLTSADLEVISMRRLKRLRGEAQSQLRLAHEHGRIEEAATVGRLLEILHQELVKRESLPPVKSVVAS